ncbi:MAG: 4a-hydroxytetrahydrobiopterin dehydratase [Phycisphaeraceae bacterium]
MAEQSEKTYNEQEIESRLRGELPHWELKDGWIRRKYKTGGWQHTMLAVNAIAYIAEAACHHPDLSVSWAELHVKLMTHSAKGVTDKDFELAGMIEKHLTWLPGEGSPLGGYEAMMKKKWTR